MKNIHHLKNIHMKGFTVIDLSVTSSYFKKCLKNKIKTNCGRKKCQTIGILFLTFMPHTYYMVKQLIWHAIIKQEEKLY